MKRADINTRQRRRENLKRLLRPRHIAFIGGRWVEESINLCCTAGFEGDIWPVNPRHDSLSEIPCFRSIADLPEPPDAALIAVSRERTVEIVRDLSACGAGGAVSIAGGFAESDARGIELQAELTDAAGDLAFVGPNCLGVMNMFDRVAVWGANNHFEPVAERGVALVSQSGYIAYTVTNVEQAFPLGYAISIGNQAVLDASDYLDVLLDDQRVGAIGLYLEGLTDVAALSEAALRALHKGIPLVVLKAGGTKESAGLAMSHSGTLAVANELWSALFERLGMVEVHTPKALVETLKLVGMTAIPRGPKLVALSYSGGFSALTAERGKRLGLEFPVPTQTQCAVLRRHLPDFASISNPLDYNLTWETVSDPAAVDEGLSCLADERCDLLVFFIDYPRLQVVANVWRPTIDGLIRLKSRTDVPVAVASVLPEGLGESLRNELHAAGIPTLQGLDDAMAAIKSAVDYGALRAAILSDSPDLGARCLPGPGPELGDTRPLDEWEAKQRLAAFGLAVPRGSLGTFDEVPSLAESLGFPVALKLVNTRLAHKSRAGAVRLKLRGADEVIAALDAIRESVAAYDPSLCADRFLVETLIEDVLAELLIGIKREAGLGLALVVGSGGTEVESLRDYQTLLLPVSDGQILQALGRLALIQRLNLEDGPLRSVLSAVRSVVRFAEQHRDSLAELDVNPLILRENGDTVAVDALIRSGAL